MLGGELSVGHSFVGGGDLPTTDSSRVGALGADLVASGGRWRIARIYTSESWNPGLRAPLDAPGVKARAGDYLLAVNGAPVTTRDEPWKALDGTAERQTVLRLGARPDGAGSWEVTVVPVRSEAQLRQRAWVEDNRRRVDSLSGGRLAYVWVPNTSQPAIAAFDRYYFAQQDRRGAVIDERFNGGGLLDDYMVALMSRRPVGGVTTQVPGGAPTRLPASGILGPKVLVTNELAGSGGDYFPWVFRQLRVGPLVGTRTWGGLVNAAVPYPLVDGGTITAPALAVFGPEGQYIAEGEGVPPDVEVLQDARAVRAGRDPQLERAVQEALALVERNGVALPPQPARFPTKARRPSAR
jgi:tricorn protease